MSIKPKVQHTAIYGPPRQGKSVKALKEILKRMKQPNRPALLAIDEPGTLVKPLAVHLEVLGLTPSVWYDQLVREGKTLGYDFGKQGASPKENKVRIEEWKSWILKGEQKLDDRLNPVIREGLDTFGSLLFNQKTWKPFTKLWRAADVGSNYFWWFAKDCTNEDTYRDMLRLLTLQETNPRELDFRLGPVKRRLRDFGDLLALQERDSESLDIDAVFENRGIILLDGESKGRVTRREFAAIAHYLTNRAIQFCRTHDNAGVIVYIDEAQSGQLDPQIGRALRESAKHGLEFWLTFHNVLSLPKELQEDLLNYISRWFIFGQISPAARRHAADMIATRLLDPHRIHSAERRSRQVHAGIAFEKRNNREFAVPIYRDQVDEQVRYMPLNDQALLVEQQLAEMGVGEFWLIDGPLVADKPVYEPMVKTPWDSFPHSLERKVETILARIMARPQYRPPLQVEPPRYRPNQERQSGETAVEKLRRLGMQ